MENVQTVISHLSRIAGKDLACDWDNSGLQVGDYQTSVEKVLVSLDITNKVVEEAISRGAGMIISHHPLIFKGLKSIHSRTETGRIIMKAIKHDLVLYSAHTNLDIASGGLNDYLAGLLDLKEIKPLAEIEKNPVYKLVVYVPQDYSSQVKEALFSAGAGHTGNYSHTSFAVPGEGTFKPGAGAEPHTGNKGELSRVDELRIETIVSAGKLRQVIKNMLKAHPYEEPAYDIFNLENEGEKRGIGRIGTLDEKIGYHDFLAKLKEIFSTELKHTGSRKEEIQRIALCTGSGGDYIKNAVYSGADIYITGEIKYHQALEAIELGLPLVKAGHYYTEVLVKDLFQNFFVESKLDIEVIKSRVETDPWKKYR